MRTIRTFAFVIGGVAAVPALALAEPGFIQMDRQDELSKFGGEFSYLVLDDMFDDVTSLRFDVHGQYVMPSGIGFYGAFPLAYASGDGESGTGIGNLEAGAIFIPRMANPNLTLVLHGGVTIPTASDGDLNDVFANLFSVGARPTDAVQVIAEGFTVRLGASPVIRSGQLFARFDGGLDLNLSNAGDDNADPLIRLNAGVGFDFGSGSVAVESINLITTDGDADDQVFNAVAVGGRFVAGSARPYVGLIVPLDDDDALNELAITAGVDALIGP